MLKPRPCVPRMPQYCHCLRSTLHRSYAIQATTSLDLEDSDVSNDSSFSLLPDNEPNILRTYKPRTPGVRHLRRPFNDHLYKGRPLLSLTYPRKGQHIGGRNWSGSITVRHRGGGHKRRIRIINYARKESGQWFVERIEHDPGRSAHIALLSRPKQGADGKNDPRYIQHLKAPIDGITRTKHLPKDRDYHYIIAPRGMRAGELVESFRKGLSQRILDDLGESNDAGMVSAKTAWRGNCLPLYMIPAGTIMYNVGLSPNKGGQLCRSAGTFAVLVNKNDTNEESAKFVSVKLQSGEVRKISRDSFATIGIASNHNHHRAQLGKAGRKRWLGFRPTVRGVAMNACDHPHGGGRGKSKGNVPSVSIWGTLVSISGICE